MKRLRLAVISAFLLFVPVAHAQYTTVSGTITDAGGQAWLYGSVSFTFIAAPNNPTGPYFLNGVPYNTGNTYSAPLDATGSFSGLQVPDNTKILPAGTLWKVQACPEATAQCYTTTLLISGPSESISSLVVPPAIQISFSPPLANARAYSDSEILNAPLGATYFNIVSNLLRQCTSPQCTWVSTNGSGNVTGPPTSTLNDAACYNNTGGTLLKDCGGPPALPYASSNGVQFVTDTGNDGNAGTDPGHPKLTYSAAESACPTHNCLIEMNGDFTVSSTISVGSTKRVVLDIRNATFTGSVSPLLIFDPRSQIITGSQTLIDQTGAGNAVICGGAGNGHINGLSGGISGNGTIEADGAGAALVVGGTSDSGNLTSNACNYATFGPLTLYAANGMGEKWGNNAYVIDHYGTKIETAQDIDMPPGLTNSKEHIDFHGGLLGLPSGGNFSTSCVYINAMVLKLYGTSVDDCGIELDGNGAQLELYGAHLENPGITTTSPFISFAATAGGPSVIIAGGDIQEDSHSGRSSFFTDNSTQGTPRYWDIRGFKIAPYDTSLAELVNNAGSGGNDYISIKGLILTQNTVSGNTATLTNAVTGLAVLADLSFDSPLALPTPTGTGACATITTQKGMWRGSFVCTGTTGASTATLTFPTAAPNGWNCAASDITHTAVASQSAASTTACTLTFSSVTANDVISFNAAPY